MDKSKTMAKKPVKARNLKKGAIRRAPLLQEMKERREEIALSTEPDDIALNEQLTAVFDGLTLKQRLFVQEYVETSNGTQSALKVYATKDENTASVMAWENLRKPNIQKAVSEYIGILAGKNFVLSKMYRLASNAKSQDTQLRATTELAKINGLYNGDNSGVKSVNIVNISLPSLEKHGAQVIDVDID